MEENISQNQPQNQSKIPQSQDTPSDAPLIFSFNDELELPSPPKEEYHQFSPEIIASPQPAVSPSIDLHLQNDALDSRFRGNDIIRGNDNQKDAIFHLEIDKIKANPFQPRREFDEETLKELAASIREFGVLQPIIVVKNEIETENGIKNEYQLIAGERRWRAAKIAGLERIPAIVKKISKKEDQMEMAIVENLQRENLNPIETARAYARLSDEFGMTQREIGARLGKSRETVANAIRLLQLPTEIQNALSEGRINESQGRLILTINDISRQMDVYKELLMNNLSVRELKNKLRREKVANQQTTDILQSSKNDPEIIHMEETLRDLLGAPVKIEDGKIVISFFSPEEIIGIIEKLNPK